MNEIEHARFVIHQASKMGQIIVTGQIVKSRMPTYLQYDQIHRAGKQEKKRIPQEHESPSLAFVLPQDPSKAIERAWKGHQRLIPSWLGHPTKEERDGARCPRLAIQEELSNFFSQSI